MLGIEGVNPNTAFNTQDKARNAALGNKIKSGAQKLGNTVESGLKPVRNFINKPTPNTRSGSALIDLAQDAGNRIKKTFPQGSPVSNLGNAVKNIPSSASRFGKGLVGATITKKQPAAAGLAAKIGGKIAGKSFMKHYQDIADYN